MLSRPAPGSDLSSPAAPCAREGGDRTGPGPENARVDRRGPFRILLVSSGNACRSQMAEGWLRHLAPGHVVVRSAGTRPRALHPLATRAMQEAGVDIAAQRGKAVAPLAAERFDLVVTLCEAAAAECPPFPNAARRIHRAFDDPEFLVGEDEADLEAYRALRDELRAFVDEILASL